MIHNLAIQVGETFEQQRGSSLQSDSPFTTTLDAEEERILETILFSDSKKQNKLNSETLSRIQESISPLDRSLSYTTDYGSVYINDKTKATELLLDEETPKVYRALAAGYLQSLSTDQDFLTGLNTRETLFRDLREQNLISSSEQSSYTLEELVPETNKRKTPRGEYGVIFLDIDHFGRLNNETAAKHAQGDHTLKEIASLIKSNVSEKAYRYGGEEFVVLAEDMSQEEAVTIAKRIRTVIESHDFTYLSESGEPTENTFHMTTSVGVAHTSSLNARDQILHYANAGENLAKRSGRNKVIYGPIDAINYELDHRESELNVQMEFSLSEQLPLRTCAYTFMEQITDDICRDDDTSSLDSFLSQDPITDGIEDIVYMVSPLTKNGKNLSQLQITRGQVAEEKDECSDYGHIKLQTKPQYFDAIKHMLLSMADHKGADRESKQYLAQGYQYIADSIKQKTEQNTMDLRFQFNSGAFTIEIETDTEQFSNNYCQQNIPDFEYKVINPRRIQLTTRLQYQ